MRVSHGNNPHSYQQQRTYSKDKDFADMFSNMAANRHGRPEYGKQGHGRPEPENSGNQSIYPDIAELNLRMSSIHRFGSTQNRFGGTQIRLTPEQLVFTKDEEPVFGVLEKRHEANTAELIVHVPTPPTYPKSIKDMSISELRTAYTAVSHAGGGFSTEGMTRQEIYDHIKGIYESYLGKDFLEVSHEKSSGPTSEDGRYNVHAALFAEFHSELKSYGLHNLTYQEVRTLEDYSVDALDKLTEKLLSRTVPPSKPRSIYDMQYPYAWAALNTISIQARTGGNIGDAEGLTREEIYERLHEVYSSYFGKDFLNGGVDTRGEGGLYDDIYLQFFDELKQYNVHSTSTDAVLSLRSYSVQALDDTWLNR